MIFSSMLTLFRIPSVGTASLSSDCIGIWGLGTNERWLPRFPTLWLRFNWDWPCSAWEHGQVAGKEGDAHTGMRPTGHTRIHPYADKRPASLRQLSLAEEVTDEVLWKVAAREPCQDLIIAASAKLA